MSNLAWFITIIICLTIVGILTMIFMARKFYWGERGAPPPSREERQRARQESEK